MSSFRSTIPAPHPATRRLPHPRAGALAGVTGTLILIGAVPFALVIFLLAGMSLSRGPDDPSGYVLPIACSSPECVQANLALMALTSSVLAGAVVSVVLAVRPRRTWIAAEAVILALALLFATLAADAVGSTLIPAVGMLLAILGARERLPDAGPPRA